MKCPYMTGNYMYSCSARREVYVPSTFEFSEYCANERHESYKACSFYLETNFQRFAGAPQDGRKPALRS